MCDGTMFRLADPQSCLNCLPIKSRDRLTGKKLFMFCYLLNFDRFFKKDRRLFKEDFTPEITRMIFKMTHQRSHFCFSRMKTRTRVADMKSNLKKKNNFIRCAPNYTKQKLRSKNQNISRFENKCQTVMYF